MKKLLALAFCLAALVGCDIHHHSDVQCWIDSGGNHWCSDGFITWLEYDNTPPTTTIIHTSTNNGGGYNNNIIVVEQAHAECNWDAPYFHDPDYCTFDEQACCTWSASLYGIEETYCYSDYCGWELVEVYEYY
jgi:hypothetical protein